MITHFERPRSVDEALALRRQHGKSACWAGGWAIVGREGQAPAFTCAIALDSLLVEGQSLAGVREQGSGLRVGALTVLQDIMDHPALPPALRAAAAFQPSRALRCMTTLGGDVAARLPDSCLGAALTALNVVLELAGDAAISVNQYGTRDQRDLILFARIPRDRRCAVARHRRSSRGPVLLTAAVGQEAAGGDAIVALGGPGLPLRRLASVEAAVNQGAQGKDVEKAVRAALRGAAAPLGDWLGSAAYKTHLAAVTVADCVAACHEGRVCAC